MGIRSRILVASTLFLSCQQAHAILMATLGDAPETDVAISTAVDDTGAGGATTRQISQFTIEKLTGASAGLDLTQTTKSDLTFIPLGFIINRNASGNGLLELNIKLSYAAENEGLKSPGQSSTSGVGDTILGLSYYARSSDTVIRTNFSVKFATGEFSDQLSTDSTDYIVSIFGRKNYGNFAAKGNAGYILRGEGSGFDWGDSYILKAGLDLPLSRAAMVGFDVTYTDTGETSPAGVLFATTTTDFAVFADYRLDSSSGFYVRVSTPVSEETGDPAGLDRDSTFSMGFSVRY